MNIRSHHRGVFETPKMWEIRIVRSTDRLGPNDEIRLDGVDFQAPTEHAHHYLRTVVSGMQAAPARVADRFVVISPDELFHFPETSCTYRVKANKHFSADNL